MNLLMKGAALAPPFSCTTKYSSDVYSPRPPDIRVRLLPTKPPVHFTTEQPGRDNKELFIRENGLNKYTKLLDFLECEVTRNTYREIVALLSSRRIRKFVYDGERYLMLRESINMPVRIFEKSALEKGLKEHQAKFDIPAEDLLSLIARYQI